MGSGRIRPEAGLVVLALAVGGCSLGGDQEAKPITGTPKQAAEAISRLERATARHDYRSICDVQFTPGARKRAGGRDCASLLRSQAGDVRRPRIDLLSIDLRGDRASVKVRTRARGQAPATVTLELVRKRGRYLIDSLGG